MRYPAIVIFLLSNFFAKAQSPGLSVTASINTKQAQGRQYKIEMKFCYPAIMTERGGWFSQDTSAIIFGNLKLSDVTCGKFSGNGDGVEVLSGNKEFAKYNFYEYRNQVFAWENILVFRITDSAAGSQAEAMYIVLPVRYKSFSTGINLENIWFQPGKLLFLDKAEASYVKAGLLIHPSLENVAGVALKDSPIADWVE